MTPGTTQPVSAAPQESALNTSIENQPSYYMTRWAWLNRILAQVEVRTNGKAGVIQRFSTFLIIGGFAAVVNLITFELGLLVPLHIDDKLHNILAYIVAAEVSIIANFIPNDRITFSHLPGHERPWTQRLLRFHITTIIGVILTFLIEFVLTYFVLIHFVPTYLTLTISRSKVHLGLRALIAEAIAIIIVLFVNFTVHHLFTYRHTEEKAA